MSVFSGYYSNVNMSLGKDAFINPNKYEIGNARVFRKFAYFPRLDTIFMWNIEERYDGLPAHRDAIDWLKLNVNNIKVNDDEDVIFGQVWGDYDDWETDLYGIVGKPRQVRNRLLKIVNDLGLPNVLN